MTKAKIELHDGDLPANLSLGNAIAVDTETLGLNPHRDRLCLVQLSAGDNTAHLVQIRPNTSAPNLCAMLADPEILKIFHFARFDIAMLSKHLGTKVTPVYCTKIASKLARTYTDRHGLKDLTSELLDVELSKQQQSSDWGAEKLTQKQLTYAASDVLYLHALRQRLDQMLEREGRKHLAQRAFKFLEARAELDLSGFGDVDIFAH